jgi:hypothetical protein
MTRGDIIELQGILDEIQGIRKTNENIETDVWRLGHRLSLLQDRVSTILNSPKAKELKKQNEIIFRKFGPVSRREISFKGWSTKGDMYDGDHWAKVTLGPPAPQ